MRACYMSEGWWVMGGGWNCSLGWAGPAGGGSMSWSMVDGCLLWGFSRNGSFLLTSARLSSSMHNTFSLSSLRSESPQHRSRDKLARPRSARSISKLQARTHKQLRHLSTRSIHPDIHKHSSPLPSHQPTNNSRSTIRSRSSVD
jgi:hypothetical protein